MKKDITRLNQKINNPSYRELLVDKDKFLNSKVPNSFEVKFNLNDKTIFLYGIVEKNQVPIQLQALKFSSNITGNELALVDTICEFSQKKDIRGIEALTLREIDSYLRDDNIISAFKNNGTKLFPLFEKVKNELIKILEQDKPKLRDQKISPNLADNYKQEASLFPYNDKISFLSLDSNERITFLNIIIEKYISKHLAIDGGGVYPVFCDDSIVVIQYTGACTSCNLSLTSTMDYIQRVIQLETKENNIMVMTDS